MYRPYHYVSNSTEHNLCIQSNGGMQHHLKGHKDRIYSICDLSNGRLASCSADHTICIWEWETNDTPVAVLREHKDMVYNMILLKDKRLVSCSDDNTIRIWKEVEPNKWTSQVLVCAHEQWDLLELSENRLASCDARNTVTIWTETKDDWIPLTFNISAKYVISCQNGFLSWGTINNSHHDECTLFRWIETPNGWKQKRFSGHKKQISCVLYFNDHIITGSYDGNIRIWGMQGGGATILRYAYHVQAIGNTLDDRILALYANGDICTWTCTGNIWTVSKMFRSCLYGCVIGQSLLDGAIRVSAFRLKQQEVWYPKWSLRSKKVGGKRKRIPRLEWEPHIIDAISQPSIEILSKKDMKDWHTTLNTMHWLLPELWGIVAEY